MEIKTVLITGASSGFGEACARWYAARGFSLILAARRRERLEKLAEELDVPVYIMQLDVRDREAVEKALDGIPAEFACVDILVNNAGLALGLAPAPEADMDDWEVMVDTNIKGLLYMTRKILPGMTARRRGHIVNMGSVAGSWPYPGGNAYGATKAFVEQFSRNLRCDVQGTGVRVTNIAPGMADTEFSLVRFKGKAEKAAATYEGVKALSAEDIAEITGWVTLQPAHVNINHLEVMPTQQAWSAFAVAREEL
ncbi:NADP-dependent 3-hydroxy acid dehydrogenase YdfG [Desulfobotulus alkaliphilus]|uniref:NADP-dependent 3-hydroxy acid dehydrogenase YdfG n=1 Tax=Desulfobotulus alkaliphilus TaxID=622671 RepID=A0A562RIN5_9BACT|nr:SDR family oxidoreductase [Desulfobotulus alkaliphilus]TWI68210.1 NADP-dependent 3-hydroxy acid dehydrogenase YdfG [Desulfobotulus alkaliphilus]